MTREGRLVYRHETRVRVAIVTKIFPNALEPLSSPFNRQQFAALGRLCQVEVLAAVPWLPGARAVWPAGRAGALSSLPRRETIEGLPVEHPRYAYVPKIGDAVAAPLFGASLAPSFARRRGRVDVVLGSWAYPDGCAAVALAALADAPAVIKLHGSDINVLGERRAVRPYLRWAFGRAAAVVAVSAALAERAVSLGAAAGKTFVVPNGVDRALFFAADRDAARARLGLDARVKLVLFVGRLTREKGALDLLDAFALVAHERREVALAMVGDGADRGACEARAKTFGNRVSFVGARPHAEVATWLAACDVLALPSHNEGSPNVVLEALAAGRPVVATRVGGIPAVVTEPTLGALVEPRDVPGLARAMIEVLDTACTAAAVVAAARPIGWDESARRLHDVLARAAGLPIAPCVGPFSANAASEADTANGAPP